MTLSVTEVLDGLLGKFLRPLRTWIEREFIVPWRAAYDAAMQTKEQYRDGVYLHLRERLEGTDEHPLAEGVPVRPLPAVQDLEHLQEAVELLGERKIEDASPAIPDGVSLVRLLCDSSLASQVTEIIDTNKGWTARNSYIIDSICALFPQLQSLRLNMVKASLGLVANNKDNTLTDLQLPHLVMAASNEYNGVFLTTKQKVLELPELTHFGYLDYSTTGDAYSGLLNSRSEVEEVIAPKLQYISTGYLLSTRTTGSPVGVRKIKFGTPMRDLISVYSSYSQFSGNPNLIHFEICADGGELSLSYHLNSYSPTMSLRTDTTAWDYIDLREDKDDSGEFINATNLEQFLANFRRYIILRLASRKNDTALTLTLSAAVYQNIYGLDSSNNTDNNSWARTHTLADLGLTADDLTDTETAAGITINTIYATWLDTYRAAINWNIGH